MNTPVALRLDGIARRIFSVDDLYRMVEVGVIGPHERLELIEGELLEMSPKGARHEWVKSELNLHFGRHLPDRVKFTQEAGWRVDELTYVEPDFLFYPAHLRIEQVKPTDALLVIEVADTSLQFDLGTKAVLYARLGVREYWVIDAAKRESHVHLMPKPDGYGAMRVYGEEIRLDPSLIRELSVTIADIPR